VVRLGEGEASAGLEEPVPVVGEPEHLPAQHHRFAELGHRPAWTRTRVRS
jgi:hypothetical protein